MLPKPLGSLKKSTPSKSRRTNFRRVVLSRKGRHSWDARSRRTTRAARIRSAWGWGRRRRGDGSGGGIGGRADRHGGGLGRRRRGGRLAGKGIAEAINPRFEDEYWRETYASRNYVREGEDYETFAPAYRYGWESYSLYPRKGFDEVEP